MGNDKRLDALNDELVRMVETGNEEIAAAQTHLQQTVNKWQTAIEQQRGRIAEREWTLTDMPPQSNDRGPKTIGHDKMVQTLKDAVNNGA